MHPPSPGPYPQGPPGWGPPSGFPPPPPKKSSSFIPILLGVATLFFGSCATYCGYIVYKSETPEGKRAAKEKDEHDNAALDGFVAKMRRVRDSLPADDSPEVRCPAGTKTALAPVVDTFYFEALLDADDDGNAKERRAASDLLRDSSFSGSILDTVHTRAGIDAGPTLFAAPFAVADIETLAKKPFVVVIDIDTMTAPEVDGDSFVGGDLAGALDVVDWGTEKTVCRTPIAAKSSEKIAYGGGVRFKVKGIPTPTVGKTDLDDAIVKDFEANVQAATKAALKNIGAE